MKPRNKDWQDRQVASKKISDFVTKSLIKKTTLERNLNLPRSIFENIKQERCVMQWEHIKKCEEFFNMTFRE